MSHPLSDWITSCLPTNRKMENLFTPPSSKPPSVSIVREREIVGELAPRRKVGDQRDF